MSLIHHGEEYLIQHKVYMLQLNINVIKFSVTCVRLVNFPVYSCSSINNTDCDSCIKLTMLNFMIRSKKRGFLPTLSELTNFHGKKKKELFNDERKISEVSEDELDISDMSTASHSTDTGETGSI